MNAAATESVSGLFIRLGSIDASIARIRAEVKVLEDKVGLLRAAAEKKSAEIAGLQRVIAERRAKSQKSEDSLQKERQGLVDRRKALSGINDYKVQVTLQREIEHASKQLDAKEETLLKGMEDLEPIEKRSEAENRDLEVLLSQLRALSSDVDESKQRLQDWEQEKLAERTAIVAGLDRQLLQTYERVRSRHPGEPVVKVIDRKVCGGCYMQLGPQVVVQALKPDVMAQCPGCKRILYIEEAPG